MTREMASLSAEECAILQQESRALGRVQRSLALAHAARARRLEASRAHAPAVELVRALRSEAARAHEDDLPALLHELSVRQTLLARPPNELLPDPASPYIAHLVLEEEGVAKDYFLGRNTHLDGKENVRIVDWRVAPVARIFYDYREGDAYEEEYPGRVAEGRVVARRVVVIEGGRLVKLVANRSVLARRADGTWASVARDAYAIAGGGAGSAVRAEVLPASAATRGANVTALLDSQQFAAISAPAERPLLVAGSAGSGKTTVALHRFARIHALAPQEYPLERMRVIVPEEGLLRLSRRLLAPLGVERAQTSTLDSWAIACARREFGRLPRLCRDAPALVSSLKRHPALFRALAARLTGKRPSAKPANLKKLRRTVAELYTDREFLDGVVGEAQGSLSRAAIEATLRHTMLQLGESVHAQLRTIIDPGRLVAVDGRGVGEATPDELAQTVDVEDLPIFLAIRSWRGELRAGTTRHLVLDEAEDFSLFDLHVLAREIDETKSVTLAGDDAQQTSSSFAGFDAALAELGLRDAEVCQLAVSYRCPRPIFELAHEVLGPLARVEPQAAARDGAPVGVFWFPSAEQASLFAVNELADLAAREPQASIAVIARDEDGARRFFALIPERAGARLVLEGDFSFERGIDVTPLDQVKGLEFDYVIVPDASRENYPESDEARRRLHVAVTRAVAHLWLICPGNPSPLLSFEGRA